MDLSPTRFVGHYELGPRIGSGSFAVVWRARHWKTGLEVAVKEIDRRLLSPRVSENLSNEISILRTTNHPNIIRLFDFVETDERIFLVLEYCDGGDLAGYILRHGKVSQAVARHFMRQLAAGLAVLQEKHLIHRDLKPQNLLLSSTHVTLQLKIGDFGFARSLTPQDLADTLCGSPLYMAPEIIQNQKYDAKADLWSVGAILFQLVTGKLPYNGNNQYQLFQNILTSTELRFPQGALEELHPDCVDLCRSLLRQNPVERLTFKEFFSHKFLRGPRLVVDVDQSSHMQMKSAVELVDSSASDKRSQLHSDRYLATRNPYLASSSEHGNNHDSISGFRSGNGSMPPIASDKRKSVDGSKCSLCQLKVTDSMESIERDYVLVNRHVASTGDSYYFGTSSQDISPTEVCVCQSKNNKQDTAVAKQIKEFTAGFVGTVQSPRVSGSDPLAACSTPTRLREVQESSILHPSTRLQLLHEYVQAIEEIAQEKYNAGQFLESFSVEMVVLAAWKKTLEICRSWMASTAGSESAGGSESSLIDGGTNLSLVTEKVDFLRPSSVCKWAEQGFIVAFERAEKLSHYLQASSEMPDAMEMIFQKAITFGISGAVDEYMNKDSASVSYSKAILLLSFIVGEATSLPLNPPFSLTPANKDRIQSYITNLRSHQSHFRMLHTFPEAKLHNSLTK